MSKVTEIKEKAFAMLNKIAEKLPFPKKAEATSSATTTASKSYDNGIFPAKLSKIYREGETGTRLFVLFTIVCFLVFTLSLGNGLLRVAQRYKRELKSLEKDNQQSGQNISDFLKNQSDYIQSMGSLVSLGKISANFRNNDSSIGHVSLDIWIKCDQPSTANYVQEIFPMLHDAVSDSLTGLSRDQIMTEKGKIEIKAQLVAAINNRLKKGKVTDIYFHNLMLQ